MLLAIDTCGAMGGVALGEVDVDSGFQSPDAGFQSPRAGFQSPEPGRAAVWSRELAGKTYSEQLLAAVDEMMREADVTLGQLAGVVVVRGPGSFTGIRIGVAAAKGLAEGLAIPVVALSRLELLARQSPEGSAVAVLDAGRGEFFVGFYRGGVRETETLLTPDALSQVVAGSGLPVVVCEQQVFAVLRDLRPTLAPQPTAADALQVGAGRFRAGLFEDVLTLDANYLRRSETEMLARIAEHAAQRGAEHATATAE